MLSLGDSGGYQQLRGSTLVAVRRGIAPVASTILALDLAGLRCARSVGHTARAERAVRGFSALGSHAAVWLVIGGIGSAVDRERRRRWRQGTVAVAESYLLNSAIKVVVGRERPRLPELPPLATTPTQLSFPSAHATTSFAAARAYAPLLRAEVVYALAVALALSRLYLGLHYPSDVLAGAMLGSVMGGVAR